MAQPPPANMGPPPGGQPSPEQIKAMQQQIAAEAARQGLTIQQYVERLKQQAMEQHQAQQRAQQMQAQQQGQQHQHQHPQQGQQQMQQQPIAPGPPKPEALAVANFLKSQELKPRTCIFQEKRKDMFRVKRAIRALQSPAYQKARTKNALLPEVHDRVTAENTFKMLPLSLLALRVSKTDPHAGHNHGTKQKRTKGLWTVQIEQQQEAHDDMHYMWLYESPYAQWKNRLYAAGALLVVLAIVMFPLWPVKLRMGVWYCSMALTGLLAAFFAMAIFRLILFLITMVVASPGLWLYPNLFEDVGFWDSFKPLWAWHESPEEIKTRLKNARKVKAARRAARANGTLSPKSESQPTAEVPVAIAAGATGSEPAPSSGVVTQRPQVATVEEGEDD